MRGRSRRAGGRSAQRAASRARGGGSAGGAPQGGGGSGGARRYGTHVDVEGGGGVGGAVCVDVDAEDVGPLGLGPAGTAGADEGALGAEDAGHGVHDDDGADLVGSMQLHEPAGGPVGVTVPVTAQQDLPYQGRLGPPQADVEKPGS